MFKFLKELVEFIVINLIIDVFTKLAIKKIKNCLN